MEQSSKTKRALYLGLLRPKTLFSGVSAVLVAIFYAYSQLGRVDLLKAALLLLVAMLAQMASNVANDLIDYENGLDTAERTGPLRPLVGGLLKKAEVKKVLWINLGLLIGASLYLLLSSPWWLMLVAVLVLIGIFAYSGGPYPLSHHGLGEVAVVLFFGLIPTVTSYCVLGGALEDAAIWHLGASIGLASANILLVNNYRDYPEDAKMGKRTIVVRLGRDVAPKLYLTLGLLSLGLLYPIYSFWGMLSMLPYVMLFSSTQRQLELREGAALNATLASTSRNVFLLALLIGLMLLLNPIIP